MKQALTPSGLLARSILCALLLALGCGSSGGGHEDPHWHVPARPAPKRTQVLQLTNEQAYRIGMQIWQNESQRSVIGLTHWNAGEEFASLGIAHFIWYPPGREGPYRESFPQFLSYVRRNGYRVPSWLAFPNPDCPWDSHRAFKRDLHSPRMQDLRNFLKATIHLQTQFAVGRLESALPDMTRGLAPDRQAHIRRQFGRMASSANGEYALIDYVNFKGEGSSPRERYQGRGWGLRQVLENMNGTSPGRLAVEEFVHSARGVLRRRVDVSPPHRYEFRYLRGWYRRLDSYLYFQP